MRRMRQQHVDQRHYVRANPEERLGLHSQKHRQTSDCKAKRRKERRPPRHHYNYKLLL